MARAQPSQHRLLKALTATAKLTHMVTGGRQPRVYGSPLHSEVFTRQDPRVGDPNTTLAKWKLPQRPVLPFSSGGSWNPLGQQGQHRTRMARASGSGGIWPPPPALTPTSCPHGTLSTEL